MPAAQLRLPPEPASVGRARRMLRDQLADWGIGEQDDVEMAAVQALNELTTNVVIHARTNFLVTIDWSGEVLRVCVDDGSAKLPAARSYGLDATTGRGLTLVSHLCRSWGVDLTDDGKRVWFEIDVGGSAGHGEVSGDRVLRLPTGGDRPNSTGRGPQLLATKPAA